jgi:glycosyltransferase involved in cell wall biosynthesis
MSNKSADIPFSVLISVYFKENSLFLKQALESIWYAQTLKPAEIVIVKDGPLTIELDKVINDFSKSAPVNIVALDRNMGLGAALNIGLKYCQYDIVARMDSDDISKPTRFEKQIKYLSRNPDIDLVSTSIDEFTGTTDHIISTRRLPEFHSEIEKFARKRCPVNHPVVIFKKSAVLRAGEYQPFPLFEDYYLWARMLMTGSKFHNLQESLLLFRTNIATYKRRGGFRHAKDDIRLQMAFKKLGFISLSRMLLNILIRATVRIFPNKLRILFYKNILRKTKLQI